MAKGGGKKGGSAVPSSKMLSGRTSSKSEKMVIGRTLSQLRSSSTKDARSSEGTAYSRRTHVSKNLDSADSRFSRRAPITGMSNTPDLSEIPNISGNDFRSLVNQTLNALRQSHEVLRFGEITAVSGADAVFYEVDVYIPEASWLDDGDIKITERLLNLQTENDLIMPRVYPSRPEHAS